LTNLHAATATHLLDAPDAIPVFICALEKFRILANLANL
jgi:hypothetical protein